MSHGTIELQVEGMTCAHCKRAVEESLAKVQGVESVVVDLQSGRATVAGTAAASDLLVAVEEEGYDATVIAPRSQHG